MLIEHLGVSGQHPNAERIFPWEWEGFTCAAPGRTQPIPSPSAGKVLGGQWQDRCTRCSISASSQVLEREERSWQSAGDFLSRNQRFGFAKAAAQPSGTEGPRCGFGEVSDLWAPSAPASPTRAGNSCGSRGGMWLRGALSGSKRHISITATLVLGQSFLQLLRGAAQHGSFCQPANSSKCYIFEQIFMLLESVPVPLARRPVHKGTGSTGAAEDGTSSP